jgi:hypothetical protein
MSPPRPSPIVCDVGALAPDATAIDALARLQLCARRLGIEIRLSNVSRELLELIELAGLGEVFSGVEPEGQPEQREQRRRVEEERELDDPAG